MNLNCSNLINSSCVNTTLNDLRWDIFIPSSILNTIDVSIIILSFVSLIMYIILNNSPPVNTRGIIPMIHCAATMYVYMTVVPLVYLQKFKYYDYINYIIGYPYFSTAIQAVSYFAIAIQIFYFFTIMGIANTRFLIQTNTDPKTKRNYEIRLNILKIFASWWAILIIVVVYAFLDYCAITIIWGILGFSLDPKFKDYVYYMQLVIYLILIIMVFLFCAYDILSNIKYWRRRERSVMDPGYFRLEYWLAGLILVTIGVPYVILYLISMFLMDSLMFSYFNIFAGFVAQIVDIVGLLIFADLPIIIAILNKFKRKVKIGDKDIYIQELYFFLEDRELYVKLAKFLAESLNGENLYYLEAVNKWNKKPDPIEAESIVKTFFLIDGKYPLNIPQTSVKKVKELLNHKIYNEDTFKSITNIVIANLRDPFSKFMLTDIYKLSKQKAEVTNDLINKSFYMNRKSSNGNLPKVLTNEKTKTTFIK
jgi:hypothetical protein